MKLAQIPETIYDIVGEYPAKGQPGEVCEKISKILNVKISDKKEIEITTILGLFDREWQAAPCDKEGATKEQSQYMDTLIDNAVNEIIEVVS